MKARVLLTHKCHRECPDCPNNNIDFQNVPTIKKITDLLDYDELILTGGEPMLNSSKTLDFVHQLNVLGYNGKIYLYTAFFTKKNMKDFKKLLYGINGITYTLHYNATVEEFMNLIKLTDMLTRFYLNNSFVSLRLNIAENIYDSDYFEGSKDFEIWNSVNKLVYLKDCPVPEDEILIQFPIF